MSKRRAAVIQKFLAKAGVEPARVLLMPMGAKPGRDGKRVDRVEISIEEVLPFGETVDIADGPPEPVSGDDGFQLEF